MSEYIDYRVPLWPLGIDNVSPPTKTAEGALPDAVNVDVDESGVTTLRAGGRSLYTASDVRSLWTDPITKTTFVAIGTQLYRATYRDGALELDAITTIPAFRDISYTYINGEIAYTTRGQSGLIDPISLATRPLGVEDVLGWNVTTAASGGLTAGRYAVAVAFVDSTGDEGGLSDIKFLDVAEGQGLTVMFPVPSSAATTHLRVYRSQQNGSDLFTAYDFPIGLGSALLGAGPLDRIQNNRGLRKLPAGDIIRAWRGRTLLAQGKYLLFSKGMRYGLFDPKTNFVPAASRITLLEGVDGGVYVGSREGITFYAGDKPSDWRAKVTGATPPIPGTSLLIPASLLPQDLRRVDPPSSWVATWLTQRGYAIGFTDGYVVEPHAAHLEIETAESGNTILFNRRLTTTLR